MSQKWTSGKIAGLFVGVFLGSLAVTLLLQAFKQEPFPTVRQKKQDGKNAVGQAISNIKSGTDNSNDKK
jgi:hypothetical protein